MTYQMQDVPYEWVAFRLAYLASDHQGLEIDGIPLSPEWYMAIVNLRWDAMIEDVLE